MRLRLLPLALAVVALAGCDTLGNDRPDRERIVGTWAASSANVRVQNVPVGIPVGDLTAAGDVQEFSFTSTGAFTFVFDPDDDRRLRITYQGTTYVDLPLPDGPVNLNGTYTLDEAQDRIRFSTLAQTTEDDFEMRYRFGALTNTLELIAEDPETLARLFGLAGEEYEAFAGIVTGGSVTYTPAR